MKISWENTFVIVMGPRQTKTVTSQVCKCLRKSKVRETFSKRCRMVLFLKINVHSNFKVSSLSKLYDTVREMRIINDVLI